MAECLFYVENLVAACESLVITGDEARHISAARRLQVGESIALTDGCGKRAAAMINEVTKSSVTVTITHVQEHSKATPEIIIACALPKGERQSDMLDQCTQLGVDGFVLMNCDYSVSKMKANSFERFQRIIKSAGKQSQRSYFPHLTSANSLKQVIQQYSNTALLCYADASGRSLFACKEGIIHNHNQWLCFIGPEGGFSESELTCLEQCGAISLNLGPHILRTETAAVVASAMLQQLRFEQITGAK